MEAAAMKYELYCTKVDIPEMDAFLTDYKAVCEKHGVQFTPHGYDGGSGYLTIERYNGSNPYLDMDEAEQGIPFIAAARERANTIREDERVREAARAAVRREQDERAAYLRLKAKYEDS
jgi:hypothetical protein